MEFQVLRRLLEDKQIVNPMNPEEVFTCKDLVDGKSITYFLSKNQLLKPH